MNNRVSQTRVRSASYAASGQSARRARPRLSCRTRNNPQATTEFGFPKSWIYGNVNCSVKKNSDRVPPNDAKTSSRKSAKQNRPQAFDNIGSREFAALQT